MILPELLVPAGNLEKLKTAVVYGADAVYIGGQRYGLRASADNFSESEIERAVSFAHEHSSKVYVAMNAFLHDDDFDGLAEFAQYLAAVKVDAVIVSDLGIVRVVKAAAPDLSVHLSTQASCVNSGSGQVWREQGVDRLILGREVSVTDACRIGELTGLEVELFIHGSMCMAFSGHCTISNFTAGRDSNRGGCIQSCRFDYVQESASGERSQSHFMSSKDLCGLEVVPEFVKAGISSVKVEGRMKSLLYVANTTRVYRQALDAYRAGCFAQVAPALAEELKAVPHRSFTQASLRKPAGADSVYTENQPSMSLATGQLLGSVLEARADRMLVRLFRPLRRGMHIEVLPFEGYPRRAEVEQINAIDGQEISEARQDSVVWLARPTEAHRLSVIRLPAEAE